MPAGIVQPGGAGTTIFVYDNAAAANGLYYTFAEIQAFSAAQVPPADQDFELLVGQNSGVVWGGSRVQYRSKVSVTIGGQAADGTAPTTIQDTNCDVYFTAGSLVYRVAGYASALLKTNFGTRVATTIGGDSFVSGIEGVDILTRTGQTFRGQIFMYGSEVYTTAGNISFNDTASGVFSEIAGCLFRAALSFTIGTGTSPSLDIYNSTFGSVSAFNQNVVTGISVRNTRNVVIASPGPNAFVRSGAVNLTMKEFRFIGDPVTSDLAWNGGGSNWNIMGPTYSNNAPRFSGVGPILSNPTKEFWYFNVKVVDLAGQPIADIPVQLLSDIEGIVVDTKTFGDGDIGFVHGTSGFGNAVLVRDHYDPLGTGLTYLVRDRVFTLKVNGHNAIFPRNISYPSWGLKFEWPGLDVYDGAYSPSGGEFKVVVMPVTLGAVGTTPPQWAECQE